MESLIITVSDKAGIYEEILPQIKEITSGESDIVANTANIAAILKEAFGFFWVGFYFVKPSGENSINSAENGSELVLGPFQGPLACTRIKYGRGVCGSAWKEKKSLVVPDVEQFPGHIACSSLSRSEIVVPVFAKDGAGNLLDEVIAVIDIDSKELSTFDQTDALYLEQLAQMI
ncbi:MAG: GAF domain-containing protein [Bacteroidales bacterium]|nr:GAF domain-containing protein [Bacteroidales bacterium]